MAEFPDDDRVSRHTMSCIECSYPLDGLRQEVCPECGRAFDPHDAETFVRVLPDPVRVQRLPIAQAHAVVAMLESRGVPARVMSEVGGVIG